MQPVKNQTVWRQTRVLFLGSALLFLANILLGFDNALTAGLIPRWQELVHVHAGTLGWVTLSMFALAIWIHTGQRDVSDRYAGRITTLVWLSIGVFAGYILAFGLAFAFGRPYTFLLPIFGISASLLIWTLAVYSVLQLRRQPVVTTAHILITAALLVAALGSTMGVLLGLEYIVGSFIPGEDRIGVHAGVMDAYLLLAAASIVDFFLRKDPQQRWTRAGLALAVVWSLHTVMMIPGLLFGIMPLIMLAAPLLLIGLIIFLARGGWRAFTISPFRGGSKRWLFFGTLWTTFWGLFFVYLIVTFADDFSAIPSWTFVVFAHSAFVGMMTNLILGVNSARTESVRQVGAWAETSALWLINLGLLVFFGVKIATDAGTGAIVIGIGVVLGVGTMIVRLWRAREEESAPEIDSEVGTDKPAGPAPA